MLALGVIAAAAEQVSGVLGDGAAPDAIEARRMQALSLAVHIPIVCFGIAFPAMILFVQGLWLRTGEPHYKALAKRWSKVALILFAIGVVTGTILSFEFGLLWPDFMATFGEVFGVAFGLEGISFFVEAIFIAIYVYGWDRLPRDALPHRHPRRRRRASSARLRDRRQRLDEPARRASRSATARSSTPAVERDVQRHMWHELVHMYVAGYLVAGFIVAGVYAHAHLRGRRDAYHRTGLVVALSFAALAAPVQLVIGDWAGRAVTEWRHCAAPRRVAGRSSRGASTCGRALRSARLAFWLARGAGGAGRLAEGGCSAAGGCRGGAWSPERRSLRRAPEPEQRLKPGAWSLEPDPPQGISAHPPS